MNTREKLIDLITGFYGVDPMYYGVETQPLVDHLIANGATIPVRCKDCKWWSDETCTNVNGAGGYISNGGWFCCSGERIANERKNESTGNP